MLNRTVYRWHIVVAHVAIIVWQAYLAFVAFRTGDTLSGLLAGLGAEVGAGVSLFLSTHRWWFVVPVIFAILGSVAIRRLDSRPMLSVGVLIAAVAAALLLNIWWREAFFGPLFALINQVG